MEADFQASIYQTLRQLTSMDERKCDHYVYFQKTRTRTSSSVRP